MTTDTPRLMTPDDPAGRLRTATPAVLHTEPVNAAGSSAHGKLRAHWQTAQEERHEGVPPPRRDNNVVANLQNTHARKLAAMRDDMEQRAIALWPLRENDGLPMRKISKMCGISHNKIVSIWRAAGLRYDPATARRKRRNRIGDNSI